MLQRLGQGRGVKWHKHFCCSHHPSLFSKRRVCEKIMKLEKHARNPSAACSGQSNTSQPLQIICTTKKERRKEKEKRKKRLIQPSEAVRILLYAHNKYNARVIEMDTILGILMFSVAMFFVMVEVRKNCIFNISTNQPVMCRSLSGYSRDSRK